MLNTPILFLVFNRLDTTKQVFAKIREIQPRQLFIGADGARAGKEGEAEKVASVRKYILDNIDWDCEVKTLFREQNLGCGRAVSEAITWFFENVEQGIILEDDTLPDLSFFTFCEELLEYYKDDERVMHIGGNNFQFGKKRGNASYYFSAYAHIWGWATWRKAWKRYKFEMTDDFLIQLRQHPMFQRMSTHEKTYWNNFFTIINQGKLDTWDLQWLASIWKNHGMAICPQKNLVANIGTGSNATHTTGTSHVTSIRAEGIFTPLIHPLQIELHKEADFFVFEKCYVSSSSKTIFSQLKRQIKRLLNLIYANKKDI